MKALFFGLNARERLMALLALGILAFLWVTAAYGRVNDVWANWQDLEKKASFHRARFAEEKKIRADVAIVCTNALAGRLLPFMADKVDPVRGQMLATAPAPRLFSCPVYADHGYDYWRQDEHGRIALGGWQGWHRPRWPIPTQRIESKLSTIGDGRPTYPASVTA